MNLREAQSHPKKLGRGMTVQNVEKKKKELLIHVLGGRQRRTLVKDCKE